MKESNQQSGMVKTIYGATYGRIARWCVLSASGLAKKQAQRGWPARQALFGQPEFKLGNSLIDAFYTPFFQISMVLWERRQKRRIQNLDESWFIPNYHFHHNNHLCIKNSVFIPAKERNKRRHSLLEHLLQKPEQPITSESK